MKVLIIGSKGFIGSHVAQILATLPNYKIYECDVIVDYVKKNYYLIDAANGDYHTVFLNEQFDVCINCSGAASVPDSLVHPLRDFTLNTYNVFKLLDCIRLYQKHCKFINISSAAVYGNPKTLPIKEEDSLNPISLYGINKMQAENICLTFFKYYGIPTCSLRVFSAYGEGIKKQLFWDIVQKCKIPGTINMFGTGNETRDFIHVKDVVQAILCYLNNGKFHGEAINIANGEEVTIKYAVDTLLSMLPNDRVVEFNGILKEGDPLNWKSDISLLTAVGYRQSIDLRQGLTRYYTWTNQL